MLNISIHPTLCVAVLSLLLYILCTLYSIEKCKLKYIVRNYSICHCFYVGILIDVIAAKAAPTITQQPEYFSLLKRKNATFANNNNNITFIFRLAFSKLCMFCMTKRKKRTLNYMKNRTKHNTRQRFTEKRLTAD